MTTFHLTDKKAKTLGLICKQVKTDLNVSVLEVSEPECLKALVDRQHCFHAVDEAFQRSLQLRDLVGQSHVFHYLKSPSNFTVRYFAVKTVLPEVKVKSTQATQETVDGCSSPSSRL